MKAIKLRPSVAWFAAHMERKLREFWNRRLPEGERKLLEVLCAAYPEAVTRDDLSDQTGFKRSTRDAYLARMTAKQLLEEPERGSVRATQVLFQ